MSCQHVFKTYLGLNETYEFCETCGKKKSDLVAPVPLKASDIYRDAPIPQKEASIELLPLWARDPVRGKQ
jgi:hypothetical protein